MTTVRTSIREYLDENGYLAYRISGYQIIRKGYKNIEGPGGEGTGAEKGRNLIHGRR